MEDKKKELLKKIATEFPALKESEKYYIAGYISHAEDTRVEKMKVQTATFQVLSQITCKTGLYCLSKLRTQENPASGHIFI